VWFFVLENLVDGIVTAGPESTGIGGRRAVYFDAHGRPATTEGKMWPIGYKLLNEVER